MVSETATPTVMKFFGHIQTIKFHASSEKHGFVWYLEVVPIPSKRDGKLYNMGKFVRNPASISKVIVGQSDLFRVNLLYPQAA